MKIGLLTFLDVANFGANLQLLSTYFFLKNHGYDVIVLNYKSYKVEAEERLSLLKRNLMHQEMPLQRKMHHDFIFEMIENCSPVLHSSKSVARYIIDNHFDGVIIGSDAVVQHWPLFSTLKLGKHRPFWIEPLQRERRFPNPFWGVGYAEHIPTVMMSVSSQNSKYQLYNSHTLKRMSTRLNQMKYISVRDEWTRAMMKIIDNTLKIDLTPDPVFALNQNMQNHIPCEDFIRAKFNLPKHYVLVGLRSQVFSMNQLKEMDERFNRQNMRCVAFVIDGSYNYSHPFSYEIPLPITPLEWFAIIKYASAYIGSNMHPIVSSLANAVPCYSIDNWGIENFWGEKNEQQSSSKVYDVLEQYGLTGNWTQINNGKCHATIIDIVSKINSFPTDFVRKTSTKRLSIYNNMMQQIQESFGSY